MLLHLCEDALVHKENGSSLAAQVGATAPALLRVAIGAVLYPLLWPTSRTLIGLALELAADSLRGRTEPAEG